MISKNQRKIYLSEPYLAGGQPDDPRIIVRDQTVLAPGNIYFTSGVYIF